MRLPTLLALLGFSTASGQAAAAKPAGGDPPFLTEPGWVALISGRELQGWRFEDPAKGGWSTARAVRWDPAGDPKALVALPGPGDRLVNGPNGKAANLVSTAEFGDIELYLEFLLAEKSNSGVYLHGLYEIQILDSHGVTRLRFGDCGGIYTRKVGEELIGGRPPLVNACRPPGQWQSLHLWFQAPRFDASGRKTASARFARVLLNGVIVQSDQAVDGPTHSAMSLPEAAKNPLMLQGDHGPVAYRQIHYRPWSGGEARSN
jgi:hypothetical protein